MKISARILISVILVLFSIPSLAWKVFPLVSYSSSSGVLLGGIVSHNMIPPFSPSAFNCVAYGYTGGSLLAGPEFFFPVGSGFMSIKADYRVDKGSSFYGWSNDGDKDVHTLAAHLDEVVVFEGQLVKEGELVGYADSTGWSAGNHLHFLEYIIV